MSKPVVVVTKGLPGSGKSTWSRNYVRAHKNWARICKQDLRRDVFENPNIGLEDNDYGGRSNKAVCDIRDAAILLLITRGYSVIVDGLSLHPDAVSHIEKVVGNRANVRVQDFTWVSLETCILRDAKRSREFSAGERAIRRLHRLYLEE